MSNFFLPFLILLSFVAVILRADFVLTLIYLFVGVFAVGRWWSRRALNSIAISREFNQRAFLYEKVEVSWRFTTGAGCRSLAAAARELAHRAGANWRFRTRDQPGARRLSLPAL